MTPRSMAGALGPCDRLQPRRLDAGDRAHLVLVRGVAGNSNRAEYHPVRVLDQHTARHRHEAALAHRREHAKEQRILGCPVAKFTRSEAHAERAPCLSECDIETQDAGLILTLERDEMA